MAPMNRGCPLTGTDSGAGQFPNYFTAFDASTPEFLRGYSAPFLTALPELGGVQMWTGLLARAPFRYGHLSIFPQAQG
jgi:hypothetical protein